MKNKLTNILAIMAAVLWLSGAMMMDSASLVLPTVLCISGIILIIPTIVKCAKQF